MVNASNNGALAVTAQVHRAHPHGAAVTCPDKIRAEADKRQILPSAMVLFGAANVPTLVAQLLKLPLLGHSGLACRYSSPLLGHHWPLKCTYTSKVSQANKYTEVTSSRVKLPAAGEVPGRFHRA